MQADFFNPLIVAEARNLFDQGKISEAWRYLADHGDDYADNAAADNE